MNPFTRFFHRLRSRSFERRAAVLRRDLADYVVAEQARIIILSHHAAWHAAQAAIPAQPLPGRPILPVIELNGHCVGADHDEEAARHPGIAPAATFHQAISPAPPITFSRHHSAS